uniref:Uncharacterized protein n=1 Tax=Setaria italica TaxID=4555 RepID=K3Z159_SETIT
MKHVHCIYIVKKKTSYFVYQLQAFFLIQSFERYSLRSCL